MKPRILPFFTALFVLASAAQANEIYDLKVYQLKSDEKAELFDSAMEQIGMPAALNSGATKVGVFGDQPGGEKSNSATRYVLTVFPTAEAYAKAINFKHENLDLQPHMAYLLADKEDAAFDRIDGSTLLAFDGIPALVDPEGEGDGNRFFELRIYESPSEGKGFLKVEMFNKSELDIFKKSGLESVFFGKAIAAANLPQLSYMLVYENQEAKDAAWKTFKTSPEWEALKNEPRYAGTVSKIHSTMLVALPYSGIK